MNKQRLIVAAAILVLGLLQAWDGGVFSAPSWVLALVCVAIAIPAFTVIVTNQIEIYGGAVVISTVLFLVARLFSEANVRWYAMGFTIAALMLVTWSYENREASKPAEKP